MACSLAVFLFFNFMFTLWIHDYYERPDVLERKNQEIAVSFQRYMMDNKVSSNDDHIIKTWTRERTHALLIIHDEAKMRPTSSLYDVFGHVELYEESYLMEFINGTYGVTIIQRPHAHASKIATYVSFFITLVLFIYLNHKLFMKRHGFITDVEQHLEQLDSKGSHSIQKHHPIETKAIIQSVNELFQTIRSTIKKEEQREQITSDLMASLSHDFKTPLTVIIGYLEILKGSQKDQKLLIDKAMERANYLHQLIEDTLYYFHSTTEGANSQTKEEVNCGELFRHYALYQGSALHGKYQFIDHLTEEPTTLVINELMMNRLFDNLLSNLLKYAHKDYPITQTNYIDNGWIVFEQTNHKDKSAKHLPSTMLGLKTCRRIMALHNGMFGIEETEDIFISKLYFPLRPDNQTT